MKNILQYIIAGAICLLSFTVSAQTFCGELTEVTASAPGKFAVQVDLSASAMFPLAASNIVLQYNNAALGSPTLVSTGMNATFYPTNVTNPNDPGISELVASINIDYLFPAGNAAFDYNIMASNTLIAVIEFDITDASLTSDIQFLYDGGTTGTVVFTTGSPPSQLLAGTGSLLGLNAPLPIVLADFDVVKEGEENAIVSWKTSAEQNASHFEVERSLDNGKHWESVGIVAAQGNSTSLTNYTFEDENLKRFIDKNQLIYYRLKTIDLDLSHVYSETKNIEITLENISIAVYPNPTVAGVHVTVHSKDKSETLSAVVKDLYGRTFIAQELGKAKMINQYVNFSELSAGTYFLSVESNGRVYATERLVVLQK